METFRVFISNPLFLYFWATLSVASLVWLTFDLIRHNAEMMSLMKIVWGLTVAYSGPLGLLIYYHAGRKQIPRDTLWRRAWRSDAHCYSGCGMGEIVGVMIASGAIGLSNNLWIGLVTFALAYTFGFGLTLGPLMQEGEGLASAVRDAFWGETTSITAMEISAIGVDLWVAGKATFDQPLFWSSLIVSLTVGLLVAYPVNVALIHYGLKEGMMNPQKA